MFGKVLEGVDVVKEIEAQGSGSGAPSKKVTIADSGQLWGKKINGAIVENIIVFAKHHQNLGLIQMKSALSFRRPLLKTTPALLENILLLYDPFMIV